MSHLRTTCATCSADGCIVHLPTNMLTVVRLTSDIEDAAFGCGERERDMIIDGISDAHRGTWSRLTRLHTASVTLPMHTSRVAETDRRSEDLTAA